MNDELLWCWLAASWMVAMSWLMMWDALH